jgi:putative ABC transport system substrate-binding protein
MKKIIVLFTVAILMAASIRLVSAQQPGKIPRVGLLIAGSPIYMRDRINLLRQGLRDLGYIEGKSIIIEDRYAEAKLERLPDLAAELVRLNVDVIISAGTPGVRAAKNATTIIPILFTDVGDPVAAGIVASLARPGANVTGLSIFAPELSGKRLELLKEAFPKVTRVAHLWTPDLAGQGLKGMQAAASTLGLQLEIIEVRKTEDFGGAFEKVKNRAHALTAQTAPIINIHQKQILEFAAKSRIPAIYSQRDWVEAGGLMSYGVSFADLWRRLATFVDKILKGTKPVDLPVEQPTKFEFIINLKTAKQMGLTIPPNVLARADRVIR